MRSMTPRRYVRRSERQNDGVRGIMSLRINGVGHRGMRVRQERPGSKAISQTCRFGHPSMEPGRAKSGRANASHCSAITRNGSHGLAHCLGPVVASYGRSRSCTDAARVSALMTRCRVRDLITTVYVLAPDGFGWLNHMDRPFPKIEHDFATFGELRAWLDALEIKPCRGTNR
jgi:hypothetical protein